MRDQIHEVVLDAVVRVGPEEQRLGRPLRVQRGLDVGPQRGQAVLRVVPARLVVLHVHLEHRRLVDPHAASGIAEVIHARVGVRRTRDRRQPVRDERVRRHRERHRIDDVGRMAPLRVERHRGLLLPRAGLRELEHVQLDVLLAEVEQVELREVGQAALDHVPRQAAVLDRLERRLGRTVPRDARDVERVARVVIRARHRREGVRRHRHERGDRRARRDLAVRQRARAGRRLAVLVQLGGVMKQVHPLRPEQAAAVVEPEQRRDILHDQRAVPEEKRMGAESPGAAIDRQAREGGLEVDLWPDPVDIERPAMDQLLRIQVDELRDRLTGIAVEPVDQDIAEIGPRPGRITELEAALAREAL